MRWEPFQSKNQERSCEKLSDCAEPCVGVSTSTLTWNNHEKDRTMNTRHTNDSKAPTLAATTAVLKLTNRMDLRLQLLLVCTAAAITAAGLTA